jgi:hypothetical protein
MASPPAFPKLLMIRACDAETGSGGVGPATATVLNVVEKKKIGQINFCNLSALLI